MENKAEQYFPTYKLYERDVVLIEFEEAQKIANGQTKVYGQLTNILLAIVTILIPLFFEPDKTENTIGIINANAILIASIIFLSGALLLRYFVELQKQITINARKVITLRTLLGLDYGAIHLTLPNWRVEGASNPFAIRYFNGWLRFESTPFWVLLVGVNTIWWLASKEKSPILLQILNYEITLTFFIGNIIICTTYLYLFRSNLNDKHETNYLNIVKLMCKVFRLKLLENFEYILYRAKLAYIELDRLQINYEPLKKHLIEIEDRDFYKNNGVSYKSLLRATISQIPIFRKKFKYIESGGSTITMQLVRTLFIPSNQNRFKRKIFEVLLTKWITFQFTKDEIIKLYIASVRYERGVIGLTNAIKYFLSERFDPRN